MKNEIKKLIKKICDAESMILTDHDLNITVLDSNLRSELKKAVGGFTFEEMNRIVGYFIEELEGDGISMVDSYFDDPQRYLKFCVEDCDQTVEELEAYVEEFKTNNLK